VHGLKARQLAPARAPRVHPAVELAGDDVETDAQQLALRLAVLRLRTSSKHERPAARDEPANPGADGAVDADVVAARDVRPVVVATGAAIDGRGSPGPSA